MGMIPLDLDVNYGGGGQGPIAVPNNFGMSRFAAQAQRGQVIANLGGQVMDIATQYAAKNKRADLMADEIAFNAQTQAVTNQAELAAAQTSDPAKVREIWEKAHVDLNTWVAGKNEETKVANIRWADQRKEVLPRVDAYRLQTQTAADMRLAQIGQQDSNAKAQREIDRGIMGGTPDAIDAGVMVMQNNGTYTAEQAETARKVNYAKMDVTVAKNNLALIEAKATPEEAVEAAKAFRASLTDKEEDGSWAAYPNLHDEEDRRQLVKQAEDAAKLVRRTAEADALAKVDADFVSGALPLGVKTDQLTKRYPYLPNEYVLRSMVNERNATIKALENQPMTLDDFTAAFDEIAKTKAEPGAGMLLAQKLDAVGFKKDNHKAVWDEFNKKFYPDGNSEKHQSRLTSAKAVFVQEMAQANDKSDWAGNLIKGTAEEKASEFGQLLASELDAMDQFIDVRMKKGMTYDKAIDEFWEQPDVKKMRDENDIKVMVNRIIDPAASEKQKQKVDAGMNTLTNTAARVQTGYTIDLQTAAKWNVPIKY